MKASLQTDPEVAIAAIVSGVVSDLLHCHKYPFAHFPEFVDLAVIATGLGTLRSNLDFVTRDGNFWDSTQWRMIPRPFLDTQGIAYANAVAAWSRGEKDPEWADDLEPDLKRSMQKSLRFLSKTEDSFFQPSKPRAGLLNQPQRDWLAMADSKSVSEQVVALRHLKQDSSLVSELQTCIADKLRSTNEAVLLNAISASEQIVDIGETAAEELKFLSQHRDSEVRSKAMIALTRLGLLDENTIAAAGQMLGSKKKHEIYAGLSALSSLGSIDDHLVPAINRAFVRSLQVCDYEFVNLFSIAFTKWLDDPKSHVENLLRQDSPEYMEIAIEALENANTSSWSD